MTRGLRIAVLIAAVALPTGPIADEFVPIGWRDLTIPIEPHDDPFFVLDYEQRRRLETVLDAARQREKGAVVSERDLSLAGKAREWLREHGLDAQQLIQKDRALLEKIALQRSSARTELAGMDVRIPGYVIPLEFAGTKVREFLLVPYHGACIHTPPPPANQIIFVRSERGTASKDCSPPYGLRVGSGSIETIERRNSRTERAGSK